MLLDDDRLGIEICQDAGPARRTREVEASEAVIKGLREP
jgi:hypothetical protein